jgi:hypothetical protein
MWGQLAGAVGSWFSKPQNQKMAVDLATKGVGAYVAGKGAKEATAMDQAGQNINTLAQPYARRDAIAQDENVAGSQVSAGTLANNMAERQNIQALKMALLGGASMGGVKAPDFLAGRVGQVSGPQWTPEQLAALKGSWDSQNSNVQTSIDDLRARKTSPLSALTLGAAQREDTRQTPLFAQMQKQAMESGALGEGFKKQGTPWWKKLLIGGGAAAGAYGLSKVLGGNKSSSGAGFGDDGSFV